MPVAYDRLPLDEPDEEQEDGPETQSCLDTLRGAMPRHTTQTHYVPLSTASGSGATQAASLSSPSCMEYVLRSVPSFRSHSRYSSVPLEDAGSDEDVTYEVDSVTGDEPSSAPHQNGDLRLQYDDHLHLLSTAHGVHGVQLPYQTRGSLRRIPAAATRLVRRANANGSISKGVRVLKKKVRSVRWSETSQLFCRWLLSCKRLLPIVSLITVIALVSSSLRRTEHLSDDLQHQRTLLMTIKKSLEFLLRENASSTSTERITSMLEDYELHRQSAGNLNADIRDEKAMNSTKNLVKINHTGSAPKLDSDELVQVMNLLQKVSSDVEKLSKMSDILSKMDKNLDSYLARRLLADKRREPKKGFFEPKLGVLEPKQGLFESKRGLFESEQGLFEPEQGTRELKQGPRVSWLSSTAHSGGVFFLAGGALSCQVGVALVWLVVLIWS